MRKSILAAVLIVGATSAALAGEGGGYNGTAVANVYEYLAAHGCPAAGFALLNCSYDSSPPEHYYRRVARRYVKRAGAGPQ